MGESEGGTHWIPAYISTSFYSFGHWPIGKAPLLRGRDLDCALVLTSQPLLLHPTPSSSYHFSPPPPSPHILPQILSRITLRIAGDVFWRASADDCSAIDSTFWSHINNPIRCFDDIKVVLDHNHRISFFNESMQHFKQLLHIITVHGTVDRAMRVYRHGLKTLMQVSFCQGQISVKRYLFWGQLCLQDVLDK